MLDKERLEGILSELPFSLNVKQRRFLELFILDYKHDNFVLQGVAGVGKSLIIDIIKKYYGDEVAIVCSTGVASQNLPCSYGTFHSYLSCPIKPHQEWDLKKVSPKSSGLFASSDKIKHLIIDECFLLNSDALFVLLKRLERFNRKYKKRKRRNIRVLLVGDSGQAVTIADDDLKAELSSRYGSHLMFESTVWKEFNFKYAVLEDIERQEDKVYKACLDVIRYNQKHRFAKCFEWLNKRVIKGEVPADYMYLSATNKTADLINQQVLDRNPNRKLHYPVEITKDFNIKDTLVREDGITLCEGLKVMTITNDEYDRWSNGSVGYVTSIDTTGAYVKFNHSGKEEYVELHTWENKEKYYEEEILEETGEVVSVLKERTLGEMVSMPLIAASAISISKSQGLTIRDDYVIDLGEDWLYTWKKMGDFGMNFLYLALSRGVDINKVHFRNPVKPCHVKVCQKSIDFWFKCKEESII